MITEEARGFPLLQEIPQPRTTTSLLTNLSDLAPGSYVKTVVIVTSIKSREREDELGKRPYIFGIAEDSTFRVPFVCYKPYQMFFKDSVFKFENAYVHEFEDHNILLVLTEYSKIEYLPEESPGDYLWQPKIGSIRRPLGYCRVSLEGVISKVYNSSGLVKRCDKCGRVIYDDSCKSCNESKWHWSVRISSKLSDETGSINTIFSQYLTCRLLERPISEVLCMANVPDKIEHQESRIVIFKVKPFDSLDIRESTVIDPAFFRQCKELIVPDNKYSKIYSPKNVSVVSKQILDVRERILKYSDENDRMIYAKILEKALDLEIRKRTNLAKIHGIYLVEEPIPLYWTESARLYLGFDLYVSAMADFIQVEFYPNGLIRESVLDYVKWRRERGASAKSIGNALLGWKKNVILAPNGTIGATSKVLFEDAGNFQIPTLNVSLPQFWEIAYGIHVGPEERPLLVVKPYNLDVELTYPPSCVFFDEQSLYLKGSVLRFVEYRKSNLKDNIFRLSRDIMENLRIDGRNTETLGDADSRIDANRLIFNDIKEKLFGKRVKATGSIVQANNRLYFFPKTITGVY